MSHDPIEASTPPMDDRDGPPPRPHPRSWPASSTDRELIAAERPPEGVCPECDGAGYYTLAVPVGHTDFGRLIPCACLIRARGERAQREQAQHTQAVLAELARALGRLALARFDTFDLNRPLVELFWSEEAFGVDVQRQALHQALADAEQYAAQPCGWLYLCGPYGAGKSHLAAATAHALATIGRGVTYASVPDLLRFVRRGIGGNAADERLDALIQIDVLILDDLGAEYLTAWASEQLFVLLNARYLAEKATILTSNDRPHALPGRFASRIAEQTQIIWMPISDYRQFRDRGER
jgi:DNA replication protein DnaC